MKSIINYQNQAFVLHFEELLKEGDIFIYQEHTCIKQVHFRSTNYIRIDFPDAHGKYLIKVRSAHHEIQKSIIL